MKDLFLLLLFALAIIGGSGYYPSTSAVLETSQEIEYLRPIEIELTPEKPSIEVKPIPPRVKESPKYHELRVLATAYCPCKKCCGKFANGKTAIGRSAYAKGIAVDRKLIPLRSKVEVPGYGTVMADDVGGSIKGNRIDVRFISHREALQWGRKYITIRWYEPTK